MSTEKPIQLQFTSLQKKKIIARFDEPQVSSDGGAILIREILRDTGITKALADALRDPRHRSYTKHFDEQLLSQRIIQICCGYPDANDCDTLRSDPMIKLAAQHLPDEPDLASQPTMSRLENRVSVNDLVRVGYALIDLFIASFPKPPQMIVLDMDPTADHVHGNQQLALFNGFEDEYCFMPFHVYDGVTGKLITTVLRPGKTPTANEIIALLKRLVKRLRQAFPKTVLTFRGDAHHTKPAVIDWLGQNAVHFITGLSINNRLKDLFSETVRQAQTRFDRTGRETRVYASGWYAAQSWSTPQRVVCRVLVNKQGVDMRFVVTSFRSAKARYLYDTVYCSRGKMELMIKDHKRGLDSDRTSCHRFLANQFRLFLHSAAYIVMHYLRDIYLKGTRLARAQFTTIRLRLLKIGTRVEQGKTRLVLHFPESYADKAILQHAVGMLSGSG